MCAMGRRLTFAAVATTVMSCTLTLGAPSAWADSQDDYFLEQLKDNRITVPSDYVDEAIHDGKLACDLKRQGLRDYDVNQRLQAKNPTSKPNVIYTLAAVAVLVYCPEYLGR
jgi:hypothetical protein